MHERRPILRHCVLLLLRTTLRTQLYIACRMFQMYFELKNIKKAVAFFLVFLQQKTHKMKCDGIKGRNRTNEMNSFSLVAVCVGCYEKSRSNKRPLRQMCACEETMPSLAATIQRIFVVVAAAAWWWWTKRRLLQCFFVIWMQCYCCSFSCQRVRTAFYYNSWILAGIRI